MKRIQSMPVMRGGLSRGDGIMKRAMSADDTQSPYDISSLPLSLSSSQPPQPLQDPFLVNQSSPKGSTLRPVLLTLIAGQGALLFGLHIGFSSPTETSIQDQANLTQTQSDLMFSLLSIGALFGCLFAAPIAERLGRRLSLILSTIPYTIGVALMALFRTYATLSLGRLFCGFGVGLTSVLVPLYIAETSPSHLRGALGSANQFFVAGGIVMINALGFPILEDPSWWTTMLWLTLIPVALLGLGMLFVGVESPHWLLRRDRVEEAEEALSFIRGKDVNVSSELNDILQGQNKEHEMEIGLDEEEEQVYDGDTPKRRDRWSNMRHLFTVSRQPFLIGIALQLFQQWTGINAIMFHTTELFVTSSSSSSTSTSERRAALVGAVLVNGVQFLTCGVTILLMRWCGRRPLLLSSHLGMVVSSVLVGLAYKLGWSQMTIIALVMVYLASFSLGVGPLPWLIASEIFPAQCRETAMSMATFVNWASAYGITASRSAMEDAISPAGVFWFYGGVGVFAIVFIYSMLPETKDFTLEEIERLFVSQYGGSRKYLDL